MPMIGLTPAARLLVELDRAEQRAVIGERERRHPELGRALDHAAIGLAPSSSE